MQEKAKRIVANWYNDQAGKDEISAVTAEDVYVVWFCKTLQNWKALLSTDLPDGMYFEVTYNGDKKEAYLDAYKKIRNVKISD
ncbi:hypothetical protein CXIVA_01830 [Clostridium sp. SY8519]|uniref:DUF6275 family protein n=1 Tax=Clostridium sp. (strain SY8519) TaxID=1042156 RepID=UPI0002171F7D|nr:DUF6275 family protein [Clostridium sp. SY8519]BAK46150.1 hypothetical protein CXIVA_01830 [Clostridium sp. SY8519]